MSSHFELVFTNDEGVRISDAGGNVPLARLLRFTATRIANGIGKLVVDVSGDFDQALLRRDNMIQVWHAPAGGVLRHWRTYFLRRWDYTMTASEGTQLALTCCCTNDLLRRRVVAAPTDTDIADKQAEADDVLRAVMRDALLPANDITTIPPPDRDWDRLTVEVDAGAAASVTSRDMSYEALLDISGGGLLTKICKKAKSDNDEELFFDIVPLTITSSGINLIFRAYLGQPGADRAALGLTFSPELGNLTDVKLGCDYTEEVNNVYTGEIGTSNSTNIRPTTDGTQERASNWNSCEAWASDLLDGIDMIKASRTMRFIGTVTQTDACVFGRDWDWGDSAKARFKSFEFNTIIRAVTIQVDDKGKETITARIDSTE